MVRWSAALLGVLLLAEVAAAQDCIGPREATRPHPPANVASDRIVPVRVKGIRFDIPRSYFRYPPDCAEDQNGLSLRALLPDMLPATPENDARLYDVVGGWGPRVQLLYGYAVHSDLEHTFNVFSYGLDRSLDFPNVHGLKFAARPHKASPVDVFFADQDGIIRFAMWCAQVGSVPFPGCTQRFLYRGELLDIHFDRSRVADWRRVQAAVTAMLDGFAKSAAIR